MKTILIIFALLLTGCASSFSHGGITTGTTVDDNNYTILGKVEGKAAAPRLLMLGLSEGDIYNAALDDLRKNASSRYGDFYARKLGLINLTVDMQAEVFILIPIFNRQVVTVSADVIEYTAGD